MSRETLREESKATVRTALAKVKITWTDPFIDVSINTETSESNRVSYPEQVADLVSEVPKKWFSTNDTDVRLDKTFFPMPSTLAEARKSQVGWWGSQNSGANGEFPSLNNPTLQVSFTSRLIEGFTLTGDNALGEYPVDFSVTVFLSVGDEYVPIEQKEVVGNSEMTFSTKFVSPHFQATRLLLKVSKWSAPNKVVKVVEFYSDITRTYESDDIMFMSILQEFEGSEGTLPVGNISCNEMELTLQNVTDQLFYRNTDSDIHSMIKRNRKIEPSLGFQYKDGTSEFVPMGLYWSGDWAVSDTDVGASTTARDRFELLRKKEFPWETVFPSTLSNISLKSLFESVLSSVFDYMYDFFYDITDLDSGTVVPHFDPKFFKGKTYFTVIKELAAASLAYAFMDTPTESEVAKNGALNKDILRVVKVDTAFPQSLDTNLAIDITKDDFLEKMQPADTESMANSISVTYRVFTADPLEPEKWTNEELIFLAEDSSNIIEFGVMGYKYQSSDLIQTESHAQEIAESLLASFKISNRNIELQTFGDITLELADQISIPEYQKRNIDKRGVFAITKITSEYEGSLRIGICGRKLKEDTSEKPYKIVQDTDGATTLWQDTDGATTKYQDTGVE